MEFSHPNDKTNECLFHRTSVLYLLNTQNFGLVYFLLQYDSEVSLIAELLQFTMLCLQKATILGFCSNLYNSFRYQFYTGSKEKTSHLKFFFWITNLCTKNTQKSLPFYHRHSSSPLYQRRIICTTAGARRSAMPLFSASVTAGKTTLSQCATKQGSASFWPCKSDRQVPTVAVKLFCHLGYRK